MQSFIYVHKMEMQFERPSSITPSFFNINTFELSFGLEHSALFFLNNMLMRFAFQKKKNNQMAPLENMIPSSVDTSRNEDGEYTTTTNGFGGNFPYLT
jgi:hypothetical protein